MGIIENQRKATGRVNTKRHFDDNIKRNASNLMDVSEIKDIIKKTLAFNSISNSRKEETKNNRTWPYVTPFRLENFLNTVDKPTLVHMMESYVVHCQESHGAVQPNGRWELCDFEIIEEVNDVLRRRTTGKDSDGNPITEDHINPEKTIVVGLLFVDVLGKSDLDYEMGKIASRQQGGMNADLLAKVLALQGLKPTENPHQSVQIEDQKTQIDAQNEKLEAQQAELARMKLAQDQTNNMLAELLAGQKAALEDKVSTKKKK